MNTSANLIIYKCP